MQLVLVRHADAGDPDPEKWPDDATRPVTDKGVKKFKKAAVGLGNLIKPDAVLTAPAARTIMTADLLNWDAGWPAPVAADELDDGRTPQEILSRIKQIPDNPQIVAVVGHGPNLVALARFLLSIGETWGGDTINFDKGGAALINIDGRIKKSGDVNGKAMLKWSMRQKDLKKLR